MGLATRPGASALSDFDRLGYHVERNAFEPELLDALEDALVRHERRRADELPRGCPRSWTPVLNECRLMNVLECGAPFERLIDHAAILPWAGALVRAPQRVTAAYSITRAFGPGLPLHRIESVEYHAAPEGPRCDHVTAAVWLCDCGPDDGPMVVFEGSHRGRARPACDEVHPSWSAPAHDRAFAAGYEARRGSAIPWEDVAGYRELHVRRGDLIVFAESLVHGAREVRSQRVRRSLYLSYSPYHFANWHGLAWSDALKQRVTPARRALLEGPFIGSRLAGFEPEGLPDRPEFPRLPDSELGERRFPARLDECAPERRVELRLERAVTRARAAPDELAGVSGTCALCLSDREWPALVLREGALSLAAPANGAATARIECALEDFDRLLAGEVEALELFHTGRARVLGDLRLAMRLASFLTA